jgi:hypothetical protein
MNTSVPPSAGAVARSLCLLRTKKFKAQRLSGQYCRDPRDAGFACGLLVTLLDKGSVLSLDHPCASSTWSGVSIPQRPLAHEDLLRVPFVMTPANPRTGGGSKIVVVINNKR